MGILTGQRIRECLSSEAIVITPFRKEQLNPNSYDLTLGAGVAVYKLWVRQDPFDCQDGTHLSPRDPNDHSVVYDCKTEPEVLNYTIGSEGWVLWPGIGYLMHTEETIMCTQHVPVLDGKSSVGRLFIKIHETAGYGDVGFDGQYTLEVTVQHPVRVYAGMRFCQMRFHETVGKIEDYKQTGSYVGAAASGPVPSKLFKQFEVK